MPRLHRYASIAQGCVSKALEVQRDAACTGRHQLPGPEIPFFLLDISRLCTYCSGHASISLRISLMYNIRLSLPLKRVECGPAFKTICRHEAWSLVDSVASHGDDRGKLLWMDFGAC